VQLADQGPIVSLELHPNLSGLEMLSAVEDTFKLIHQGFGKHRLKHFLADGTSAWISPSKSLTNQVSAITEGHLLVLVANGEVRYHLGVEDATVFKLGEFEHPSNLGSGAFGEVGLFRHKATGENAALTCVFPTSISIKIFSDLDAIERSDASVLAGIAILHLYAFVAWVISRPSGPTRASRHCLRRSSTLRASSGRCQTECA
jgi:hypothetical protein